MISLWTPSTRRKTSWPWTCTAAPEPLPCRSPAAATVAAVEAYGPAVRDLRRNLEINKLDNVDVIGGDAVREFPDQDADVLVVDPPRAGLAPRRSTLSPARVLAMSPT